MKKREYTYSICPECNGDNVSIVDSRPSNKYGFHSIRRRRKCMLCNYKYTTYEVPLAMIEKLFLFTKQKQQALILMKKLTEV